MKTRIIFMATLCLNFGTIYSQSDNSLQTSLSINSTGTVADASSILDCASTTKGVLISRMTTAQRNAIGSPATSLLVYDTDLDQYCYYNGTAWVCYVEGCETLDEAYDCGGAGAGATVLVTDGPVFLDGTGAPTNGSEILYVEHGADGPAIEAKSAQGVGIYSESTDSIAITAYAPNDVGVFSTSDTSDGVLGCSGAQTCTRAGVTGRGGGDRLTASALEANDTVLLR